MSCGCTGKSEGTDECKDFHRRILSVLLKQKQTKCSNRLSKDPKINLVPNFTVFEESQMVEASKTIKTLLRMSSDEMLNTLSTLRNHETPVTSAFIEFISRVSLLKHQETRLLCLPPVHQTQPYHFFKNRDFEKIDVIENEYKNTTLDPEQKLAWWREDVGLCEHHFNWHATYPFTEPNHDRQGELFAYMHQQMLARLDFERLALGMERVHAYGPGYRWDKPLPEGYNPELRGFSFRPGDMSLGSITRLNGTRGTYMQLTDDVIRNVYRIYYGLASGNLESTNGSSVNITMDLLGNTIESNMGSVNKKLYGNIHNLGHLIIARINDPLSKYNIAPGPMGDNWTAPRDPVFYRWHKFLDSFFEEFRASQTPYQKEDLLFANIEMISVKVITEDLPLPKANRLFTFMELKKYNVYNAYGSTANEAEMKPWSVFKERLNYKPFHYEFTVKNSRNKTALVIFRVFVAPKSSDRLEDRRNMFVELDRFVKEVSPGVVTIQRSYVDSSVILQPQASVEDIVQGTAKPGTNPVCGCGWPRNLLLPRGTQTGMSVDLFVIATNWEEDRADFNTTLSGSVSYCGKRRGLYPDKRAMGFPLDRNMRYDSLEDMIHDVPNSMSIPLKIVYLKDEYDGKQNLESQMNLQPKEDLEIKQGMKIKQSLKPSQDMKRIQDMKPKQDLEAKDTCIRQCPCRSLSESSGTTETFIVI